MGPPGHEAHGTRDDVVSRKITFSVTYKDHVTHLTLSLATTVKELKMQLKSWSGIEPETQKLCCLRTWMVSNAQTLYEFGLEEGDKVTLVENKKAYVPHNRTRVSPSKPPAPVRPQPVPTSNAADAVENYMETMAQYALGPKVPPTTPPVAPRRGLLRLPNPRRQPHSLRELRQRERSLSPSKGGRWEGCDISPRKSEQKRRDREKQRLLQEGQDNAMTGSGRDNGKVNSLGLSTPTGRPVRPSSPPQKEEEVRFAPIELLPEHILGKIFSHLSLVDKYRVGQVCLTLRAALYTQANAWPRLDLTRYPRIRDKQLVRLVKHVPYSHELILTNCMHLTDTGVRKVLRILGDRLTKLHLGGCQLRADLLMLVPKYCPGLRYVVLPHCCRNKDTGHLDTWTPPQVLGLIASSCPQLRHLECFTAHANDTVLVQLSRHCRYLDSLLLGDASGTEALVITDPGVEALLSSCLRLRVLVLRNAFHLTGQVMSLLGVHSRGLKTLHLSRGTGNDVPLAMNLTPRTHIFKRLVHLELYGCRLREVDIHTMAEFTPNVETLTLVNCTRRKYNLGLAFERWAFLQHVKLVGIQLSDDHCQELSRYCERIQTLHISSEFLSNVAISAVGGLKYLITLTVMNAKITGDALDILAQSQCAATLTSLEFINCPSLGRHGRMDMGSMSSIPSHTKDTASPSTPTTTTTTTNPITTPSATASTTATPADTAQEGGTSPRPLPLSPAENRVPDLVQGVDSTDSLIFDTSSAFITTSMSGQMLIPVARLDKVESFRLADCEHLSRPTLIYMARFLPHLQLFRLDGCHVAVPYTEIKNLCPDVVINIDGWIRRT